MAKTRVGKQRKSNQICRSWRWSKRSTLTPTGAFPHAHQPGAARVCLPGVGHAAGDSLHGRPRVRRPPQDDQQAVPPPAQGGREAATARWATCYLIIAPPVFNPHRKRSITVAVSVLQDPQKAWGSTWWPLARPWRWETGVPATHSSSMRRWTVKSGTCSLRLSEYERCSSGEERFGSHVYLNVFVLNFNFLFILLK